MDLAGSKSRLHENITSNNVHAQCFQRMEKVTWKSLSSIVKIVGAAVSILGALVVVLCKGPVVLSNTSSDPTELDLLGPSAEPNWILGGLCFSLQYLLNSVWYILQTHIVKLYPDELVVVCVYYIIQAMLSALVCFLAETDISAWRLRTHLALLAVLISGFLGQSFVTMIHTWGLQFKGPVYVSSFRPISIVIAAAMGVIFLGDNLYFGSVTGAIIIACGFYAIMWGKAKEELKEECGSCGLESSSHAKDPLLH